MKHTEESAKQAWQRWRNILDKIISHKDYRYDSNKKWPLLKMARFVSEQLGIYNTIRWQIHNKSCDKRYHRKNGCLNVV